MIDLGQGLTVEIVESSLNIRHDIYQDHIIVGAFGTDTKVVDKGDLRRIIWGLQKSDSLFGEITADILREDDAIE